MSLFFSLSQLSMQIVSISGILGWAHNLDRSRTLKWRVWKPTHQKKKKKKNLITYYLGKWRGKFRLRRLTTRRQGRWHSKRGGEDFLRKLLSSQLSAMLKLVSWSFLKQESSLNTPAQGFNLFLTLLSTYRKTFSIFSFFFSREKNPFFCL